MSNEARWTRSEARVVLPFKQSDLLRGMVRLYLHPDEGPVASDRVVLTREECVDFSPWLELSVDGDAISTDLGYDESNLRMALGIRYPKLMDFRPIGEWALKDIPSEVPLEDWVHQLKFGDVDVCLILFNQNEITTVEGDRLGPSSNLGSVTFRLALESEQSAFRIKFVDDETLASHGYQTEIPWTVHFLSDDFEQDVASVVEIWVHKHLDGKLQQIVDRSHEGRLIATGMVADVLTDICSYVLKHCDESGELGPGDDNEGTIGLVLKTFPGLSIAEAKSIADDEPQKIRGYVLRSIKLKETLERYRPHGGAL